MESQDLKKDESDKDNCEDEKCNKKIDSVNDNEPLTIKKATNVSLLKDLYELRNSKVNFFFQIFQFVIFHFQ